MFVGDVCLFKDVTGECRGDVAVIAKMGIGLSILGLMLVCRWAMHVRKLEEVMVRCASSRTMQCSFDCLCKV